MAISPVLSPTIRPIEHDAKVSAGVDFGAKVTNVDLAKMDERTFELIEQGLYRYKVLVIPNQGHLTPEEQFEFVRRFDPTAPAEHGHNDATASHKGQPSLLYGIGNEISIHPEIKLVGGGKQSERFGGRVLKQADHTSYHQSPLSEEERESGLTRFHRWHMDAALYKTSLPLVTSLLACELPKGPPLTIRWDDGSGATLAGVAPGSTAFLSGNKMYEMLSPEDKMMADNSQVMYAPHPYQWGGACKGNSNGLGTFSDGKEMSIADLPEWTEGDLKTYSMVWTNPHTGEKSLQVHSVAVWKLLIKTSPDSPVKEVNDLLTVRKFLYNLQRPALEPENVFVPAYTVGDLVLFYNRGVYHSATDYPESYGTRSMLQAHIAGSFDPK